MSNENNFQGIDISKITQYDLMSVFPDFPPLLVSTTENWDDDKLRVIEVYTFSNHYDISELTTKIIDYYQNIYPDIF